MAAIGPRDENAAVRAEAPVCDCRLGECAGGFVFGDGRRGNGELPPNRTPSARRKESILSSPWAAAMTFHRFSSARPVVAC